MYLHREPVDFRKQINGLSVIVSEAMQLDPFKPVLYVFVNRGRNRIKVLYWDSNGFFLWLKRLEKRQFVWPLTHDRSTVKFRRTRPVSRHRGAAAQGAVHAVADGNE